jgi:hypothetical protein
MRKRNFISLVLLFIFSFVLLHNVIPHHHHDELSEINNHEHKHHHDKKEPDHQNKNDEPIGFFSHPTHILASNEFIFSRDNSFQKTQYVSQIFLIDDYVIKPTAIPIKHKPPNYISVIPLQFFYSTHSLRGPPVFSV